MHIRTMDTAIILQLLDHFSDTHPNNCYFCTYIRTYVCNPPHPSLPHQSAAPVSSWLPHECPHQSGGHPCSAAPHLAETVSSSDSPAGTGRCSLHSASPRAAPHAGTPAGTDDAPGRSSHYKQGRYSYVISGALQQHNLSLSCDYAHTHTQVHTYTHKSVGAVTQRILYSINW